MSLGSTTCLHYHTVTEHDSSNNIVYVHRFTGKSMFGVNCKATYRSDIGHLFNTRNFKLTKATNDDVPCHYDAHPLELAFCKGNRYVDQSWDGDACDTAPTCSNNCAGGECWWQRNAKGIRRQCIPCTGGDCLGPVGQQLRCQPDPLNQCRAPTPAPGPTLPPTPPPSCQTRNVSNCTSYNKDMSSCMLSHTTNGDLNYNCMWTYGVCHQDELQCTLPPP